MSFQAQTWALEQTVGFPWGKAVLIAIANYADEDGQCWPSQERLAKDLEVSDRTIREKLSALENHGFLTRTRRQKGGMRQTDLLKLNISGVERPSGKPTQPEVHAEPTGISRMSEPEGASREPSIEPSKEKELPPTPFDTFLDPEREAFEMFASMGKEQKLTVPQVLNETRRAQIRQRLRDCGGLDGWRAAVDKVAASPYLTGKVVNWKADLDFVLNPTRFAKIMEGGYDGRTDTPQTNGQCRNAARQDAINEAARELAAEFG